MCSGIDLYMLFIYMKKFRMITHAYVTSAKTGEAVLNVWPLQFIKLLGADLDSQYIRFSFECE